MPLPVLPGMGDFGNALLGTVISSQTLKAAKTTSQATDLPTDVPTAAPIAVLTSPDTPTVPVVKPTTPKLTTPVIETQAPIPVATPVVEGPTINLTFDTSAPTDILPPPPPPPPKSTRTPKSVTAQQSDSLPSFAISAQASTPKKTRDSASPTTAAIVPILTDSSEPISFTTLTTGLDSETVVPFVTQSDEKSSVSLPTQKPTSGIISSTEASKSGDKPSKKSNAGAVAGGVIGALAAVILFGLLAFFLWKWWQRRKAMKDARTSFGPYGNGIDASTGSALVSSLPPKLDPPMTEFQRNDFTRYARPSTSPKASPQESIPATASSSTLSPISPLRPNLNRGFSTIEEMSERGSSDVSTLLTAKKGPLRVLNPEANEANPFDDSYAISEKKEPTLPSISIEESPPLAPTVPTSGSNSAPSAATGGAAIAGAAAIGATAVGAAAAGARPQNRSPTRDRSQSLDEANKDNQEPRIWANSGLQGPPGNAFAIPPRGMGPPRNRPMHDPSRGPHPGPGPYKYPSIRDRYPPNRMGNGPGPGPYPVRRRRSASMDMNGSGYPRNPVLDPPSWQRWAGPPPARGPRRDPNYGPEPDVEQGLRRRPSAASIRERPSPENWSPTIDNTYPQQGPMVMRPGAAQSQPDLHAYSGPRSPQDPSGRIGPLPSQDNGRYYGPPGNGSRGAAARNF